MPRLPCRSLTAVLTTAALAACGTAPVMHEAAAPTPVAASVPSPTKSAPGASAFDHAVEHGNVIVSAQPTSADLASLHDRGIERVFNLRSDEEMAPADLGFDEDDVLGKASIPYGRAPVTGAASYTPEALEQFRRFVEGSHGKVLLHCASGARASQLMAAYEVKYLGKSPDEALRGLAPFGGWPLPLERLTGMKLTVEGKPASDGFEDAKH